MPLSAPERTYTPVTYACGGCETRWAGVSRCHCSACHRTFAGIGPFDRHRREVRGVGTCLDPELIMVEAADETTERAMFLTAGIWSTVENPKPRGQHLRKSK